ncbi:MAG: MATE family efflux transporter, partial [Lachnospiraceae bacterium]
IFSALGDSKTPFLFLAFSSTSNILVDILFVAVFDLGVAGVAWATFLCQGVSCVLAVLAVLKRLAKIPSEGKGVLFSLPLLKRIALIAVPSILQQSFISVGNIILQGAINDCGVGVTAGYAAAIKLNNLVITSFTTLGNGISNYTSQNIGAGSLSRVKEGFKAGVKMVWLLCVPIVVLYLTAAKQLVTFFIEEPSELALSSGIRFLYIVAPFYFVVSVKLVADGILRGAGLMKKFMLATFTDLVLRVVIAGVLSKHIGYIGIWCAWPIGWSIAMGMSVAFYHGRFGKRGEGKK